MPKSAGDFGDSAGERTEGGRGGIWILSCDPKRTILLSGLESFGSDSSWVRASTMPRPIILESNLSQWRLGSGSEGLMVDVVFVKGFRKPENGLLSSMEVGLIIVSVSEKTFEEKPVKSRGELKKDDEGGLLCLSVGDGREPQSAIRACLLVDALDLFLSIIPLDSNKPQQFY